MVANLYVLTKMKLVASMAGMKGLKTVGTKVVLLVEMMDSGLVSMMVVTKVEMRVSSWVEMLVVGRVLKRVVLLVVSKAASRAVMRDML